MSVGDALAKAELITSIPKRQQDALVAFGKVTTKLRAAAERLALPDLLDEVTALTGTRHTSRTGRRGGGALGECPGAPDARRRVHQSSTGRAAASFLEQIALVSDVDEYKDAKPSATLITMHAGKGGSSSHRLHDRDGGRCLPTRPRDPRAAAKRSSRRSVASATSVSRGPRTAPISRMPAADRSSATPNMNPPSRFLMELPSEGVELRGRIETEERDTWARARLGARPRAATRSENRRGATRCSPGFLGLDRSPDAGAYRHCRPRTRVPRRDRVAPPCPRRGMGRFKPRAGRR